MASDDQTPVPGSSPGVTQPVPQPGPAYQPYPAQHATVPAAPAQNAHPGQPAPGYPPPGTPAFGGTAGFGGTPAAAPAWRRSGRTGLIAGAAAGVVLLAGLSFGAGVAVGHDRGVNSVSAGTQTGQNGFTPPGTGGTQGQGGTQQAPGGGFGGGVPGGQAPDSTQGGTGTQGSNTGIAIGQIAAVDGSTITLVTSGGELPVTISADTVISDALGGSVDGLETGQIVVVQGTVNGDSLAATAIADRSSWRDQRGGTGSADSGTGSTDGGDGQTT